MTFGRSKKQPAPLDESGLYDYAVKALGRRTRTVAELKRLMRNRVESGEPGEAKIERVIARLKEQRYLNDTGYASSYARMRQENQSFSAAIDFSEEPRNSVWSIPISKSGRSSRWSGAKRMAAPPRPRWNGTSRPKSAWLSAPFLIPKLCAKRTPKAGVLKYKLSPESAAD